jgi:DNA repair photolyase
MNYWELRKIVSRIIPRMSRFPSPNRKTGMVKEKGRKSGYHQYDLKLQDWKKQERLLNTEEVRSFVEISLRAAACPMPFNMDVWDGLVCPFACRYCFANAFRASLYTAFFDNSKTMGFRHCNPDFYKREWDKLASHRGKSAHDVTGDVQKAVAMEMPVRFGIRFEDFLRTERRKGVSLQMLEFLGAQDYPLMINTKSDLVGTEPYVRALSENRGKTAVHVTVISSDDRLLNKLEPGAPRYERRLDAIRNLVAAGVRVVARIEPYLVFLTDEPEFVQKYMDDFWEAGVRHITFDTYSYSANNPGIRQDFMNEGLDFNRLFLLGCDSQALGSLLLHYFMKEFQARGFSCSTFDMGNAPLNNQSVCCEVGDWFESSGFNYGSTMMAARFIIGRGLTPTAWADFENFVNDHGGFLSDSLRKDVHQLWNGQGNNAYSHHWSQGIEAVGSDENGLVWVYREQSDFRKEVLEASI